MNLQKIYVWLFAILYVSVAFVSTFHAISFFGLANNIYLATILAISFEIGQAAVSFSLLTNSKNRKKFMPWVLMCTFTLVQVLGNVFSSYKYLMTYAEADLIFFKNPVFMWTDLPDAQCNVILSYVIGAILPICSLLLTEMVTDNLQSYDIKQEENNIESTKQEEKPKIEQLTIKEPEIEKNNQPNSGFVNI